MSMEAHKTSNSDAMLHAFTAATDAAESLQCPNDNNNNETLAVKAARYRLENKMSPDLYGLVIIVTHLPQLL